MISVYSNRFLRNAILRLTQVLPVSTVLEVITTVVMMSWFGKMVVTMHFHPVTTIGFGIRYFESLAC